MAKEYTFKKIETSHYEVHHNQFGKLGYVKQFSREEKDGWGRYANIKIKKWWKCSLDNEKWHGSFNHAKSRLDAVTGYDGLLSRWKKATCPKPLYDFARQTDLVCEGMAGNYAEIKIHVMKVMGKLVWLIRYNNFFIGHKKSGYFVDRLGANAKDKPVITGKSKNSVIKKVMLLEKQDEIARHLNIQKLTMQVHILFLKGKNRKGSFGTPAFFVYSERPLADLRMKVSTGQRTIRNEGMTARGQNCSWLPCSTGTRQRGSYEQV